MRPKSRQLPPIIKVTILVMMGIFGADRFLVVGDAYLLLTLGFACTLSVFLLGKYPLFRDFLIYTCLFIAGSELYLVHRLFVSPLHYSSGRSSFTAVIITPVVPTEKGCRAECVVTSTHPDVYDKPFKALLSIDSVQMRGQAETSVLVGDVVEGEGYVRPFRTFKYSNHFDYVRWAEVNGLRCRIYTRSDKACLVDGAKTSRAISTMGMVRRIRLLAMRVRQHLIQRYHLTALSPSTAAVLSALTLGDKSMLDRDVKSLYAHAGVSHVLSLSGLHLGIIYAVLSLLVHTFVPAARIRGYRRRLSTIFILSSIWFFVVMVGMHPGVLRAACMITLYSIAGEMGTDYGGMQHLFFAALLMLCVNPLSLWDIGFQLSFVSVFFILWLCSSFMRALPSRLRHHPVASAPMGLICMTLAAQIGTLPLTLYYFGMFSTCFLLANILILPLITLMLYLSLSLMIIPLDSYLSVGVSILLNNLCEALTILMQKLVSLPGSFITDIHCRVIDVILLYVLIVAVYHLFKRVYVVLLFYYRYLGVR